jgi:hypothetical protein
MPPTAPTGIVTRMVTDIHGSSTLWDRLHERFQAVLDRHNALLREQIARFSTALQELLWRRGPWNEARQWLDLGLMAAEALPGPEAPRLRAKVLRAQARIADHLVQNQGTCFEKGSHCEQGTAERPGQARNTPQKRFVS